MENNNIPREELREKYKNYFESLSKQELVDSFNKQVGNCGWSSSRAIYLYELRKVLDKSGINISSVQNDSGGFNLNKKVKLEGNRLTYFD